MLPEIACSSRTTKQLICIMRAISRYRSLSYFDENFWFNVRGSNTENKLRINIEADTQEILDQVLKKISSSI